MPWLEPSSNAQKKCAKCQEWKSLKEFRKDRSRPDGLEYYCKNCKRPLRENAPTGPVSKKLEKDIQGIRRAVLQTLKGRNDLLTQLKAQLVIECLGHDPLELPQPPKLKVVPDSQSPTTSSFKRLPGMSDEEWAEFLEAMVAMRPKPKGNSGGS